MWLAIGICAALAIGGLGLAAGAGVLCLLLAGNTGHRASGQHPGRNRAQAPGRHVMTVPLAAAGTERIPVVRSFTGRQPWDTAVRPADRA